MTLFEVAVLGSMLTLGLAAAMLWAKTGASAAHADEALRRAVPLRAALEGWQGENARGCPTVSELVEERYLARQAVVEDPWGGRYRIVCDGAAAVVSAGPDRVPATDDDVILRVED